MIRLKPIRRPDLPRFRRLTLAAVAMPLLSAVAPTLGQEVDVASELARLQASYGFSVSGDEHLEDAVGRAEGDDVYRRLRLLLTRFDHIIVQAPGGGIDKVLIIGPTVPVTPSTQVEVSDDGNGTDDPATAGDIEMPTVRDGNQHSVRVTLEGVSGKTVDSLLLIDTGADTVVLPTSMIAALGLAKEGLEERKVQTANGSAMAQMGSLPAVLLGGQRIGDVAVAFIDDDKLGGRGLLGMSVLGGYRMTIDDEHSRLTLTRR